MRIFRAFPQAELLEGVDAGSGGGGAAPSGGSPSGGSGAPGAAGGGVASTPVSLSDDTVVTLGGKTAPWKEHQAGYVPKSQYDEVSGKFTTFQNNLRNLAANLKNNPQFRPNGGAPQQRVDPFAQVRNMPIVDGATLAQLAENGLGGLAKQIEATQRQNAEMAKKLSALERGVGSVHERNAQGDFSKRVDGVISSLGEGYDPKNETLRTIAEDVFYAYDWKGNEVEAEYPKLVKARIDGLRKVFRAMDQAELKAAKERRFVRPGGNGTPGGAARFNPRNAAKEAADMLFGAGNQRT